jgi:hypothetical protein
MNPVSIETHTLQRPRYYGHLGVNAAKLILMTYFD